MFRYRWSVLLIEYLFIESIIRHQMNILNSIQTSDWYITTTWLQVFYLRIKSQEDIGVTEEKADAINRTLKYGNKSMVINCHTFGYLSISEKSQGLDLVLVK